jgi:beta-aspartyl-dipeptidase (metallo-type)
MLQLISQTDVYAPESLGVKDILIAGDRIIKIADRIEIEGIDVKVIERKGCKTIPGLIDNHVHVLGGGGEAGYHSRVPEITIDRLIKAGVTSVVGLLGTDGFTRNMRDLIAKIKALRHEGMSAYAMTGSYQVPPRTLFKTIEDDVLMVEEIIGLGEIAIADHRSSQPTVKDLTRAIASAHVGGLLAGKAGISNIHVGNGKDGLFILFKVLEKSDIPVSKIHPTHVNRSHDLLDQGIHYSKTYKATIDFTTGLKEGPLSAHQAYAHAIEQGVDPKRITFSSDGQGSLPVFDGNGKCVGMGIGEVNTLYQSVRKAHRESGLSWELALGPVTTHVAQIYHLKGKGKIAEGYDADLVILDQNDEIHDVFMRGRQAMDGRSLRMRGTFSQA